ncbi:MAG: DUF4038 domain-containing protein [Saprospiraceae bacterium]|nr:DUF4038 domain-containing protein [Saprospiraceae bacterium]
MKSRIITSIFLLLLLPQSGFCQDLLVSENGRYLEHRDGKPFFYLGDTAWELFHRLSLREAKQYLHDRKDKGFTVIQAVILAQLDGLTVPNANGDLPLHNGDPAQPQENYFGHVDAIVHVADSLGLYIGMLPTWGSYWSSTNGDEKIFTPSSAGSFGSFLGARYRDQRIIWILGGDENINSDSERAIVEAMATGLKLGDQGAHLMTFHPRGPGRSSDYFHDATWLDFHMFQSSHASHDHDNGLYAEHDYQLTPVKPTLDGEPRYELIPVGFYFQGANRLDLFDDYDCRQAAYWSILSGSCGHTYGHNSIWQMWSSDKAPVLSAVIPWYEAVDHPGAFQMKHLRTLFELRSFHLLKPTPELVLRTLSKLPVKASLAFDQSFAIFYSSSGDSFTVDQSVISGDKIRSIWYDPRYGIAHSIHTGNTKGIQTYTPPTNGRGHDWILILEDAGKKMPLPGDKGN